MNALRAMLFAGLSFLFLSPSLLLAADYEIGNYTLVGSTRISRTVYENTYKADVSNWNGTDSNITATVTSTASHIVVVKNSLNFGDVPYGATVESTDTFIVRHDRSKPFDTAALVWTVTATPLPPTTFALIDQALANGSITAETALVYKVYDSFGDGRLPPEYRGRDDGFIDNPVISTVQAQFDSLSPATKDLLAPFLLAANEPGSWQELQFNGTTASPQGASSGQPMLLAAAGPALQWQPVPTANGKVIVWWLPQRPQDEARAHAFANELDAYLWNKLVSPFRAPLPDVLALDSQGNAIYNFGDPRLDILLTTSARAQTVLPKRICDGSARGVAINLTPRSDKYELAHELMHAIEYAFPVTTCHAGSDFRWMAEATANWAIQFAYPSANVEHGDLRHKGAKDFLADPELPISYTNDGHEYGAYLWFFRLAGQGNDPTIVNATWNAAYDKSSLDAIESMLQGFGFGGFDKQWPAFVLDNWNRVAGVAALGKPYRDYFRWDKLKHRAKEADPVKLSLLGASWQNVQIGYALPRLSATYRRYDFTADQNIRGILFMNTNAGQTPTASIQAIVKVKGKDWQLAEDWTNSPEKFFCRDKAEEDIEQVVLVIANRGFRTSDPATVEDQGNFNLFYSALPCHDWIGSATYRREETGGGGSQVVTSTANNLRFHPQLTQNRAFWLAVEGVVTWNQVGVAPFEDGSCTSTASGSYAAKDRGNFTLLPIGNALQFSGNGFSPLSATVHVTCTSSSGSFSYTYDDPVFNFVWFSTGPDPWPVAAGATTIQGNYASPPGSVVDEWTWSFSKAP